MIRWGILFMLKQLIMSRVNEAMRCDAMQRLDENWPAKYGISKCGIKWKGEKRKPKNGFINGTAEHN